MTDLGVIERLRIEDVLETARLLDRVEEEGSSGELDELALSLLRNDVLQLMDLPPAMQDRLAGKLHFEAVPPLLVDVIQLPDGDD